MNDIQIFKNQELGEIRVLDINGEPWFVGKDVAEILGYAKARNAIANHIEDEDKKYAPIQGILGGTQNMTIINESGLYSLILSSKLPSSKKFKRWITNDVLPSIRKHGMYMTDSLLEKVIKEPQIIITMAKQLVEQERIANLYKNKLIMTLPKAEYFDQFVSALDCTNIRDTGKELGVSQNDFIKFLLEKGFLYRNAKGNLRPYELYCKKEYFILKDLYICKGEMIQQTLITCKGKNYFMKLIKKECE